MALYMIPLSITTHTNQQTGSLGHYDTGKRLPNPI
jgi:hypothetical protein